MIKNWGEMRCVSIILPKAIIYHGVFGNEHKAPNALNLSIVGVANGKCETLRDGETSVFLCEPETF